MSVEIGAINTAKRDQARPVPRGDPIKMCQERLHGGVETIALGQLKAQALAREQAKIPVGATSWQIRSTRSSFSGMTPRRAATASGASVR
jgi:hypothetical protein